MKRIGRPRLILSLTLLVTAVLGVLPVAAQNGYPTRVDPYVNDFASLLTTEHTASLRSLFSELKTENGVEIVVVTLDSIHDYATGDASIESFATNLFNTWGIGTAQKNDGVLILVAWKDREVRIEVGAGFGDSLNAD
ncbi:MAG TPA: TPM domain-containing protein, partial [Anaerolineae bacterium]|nr:TPM domain-containing protein [Anaerolineae bacterium]